MEKIKRWDVFISHATPDKEEFVLPLAEALRSRGLSVWLDRWEIELGDSISSSISEGLVLSKFGVVVLSKAFFSRAWPKKELGTLFAKESDGASHIIPIWHKIDHQEVLENAPLLADRMAAQSSDGIHSVADRVQRLLTREAVTEEGGVSADEIRALTRRLFPQLPVDEFWQTQLLADLDSALYKSVADIELAYRRAQPAIEAFARENPALFRAGTDYLTKSLGFVDLCFRSRHNWASETKAAFLRHAGKVKW
jgi:hypothetical protein